MEKLFKFLRQFFTGKFFGSITIRFESGKVTHVEVQSRRVFEYGELPSEGNWDLIKGMRQGEH